MTIRYRDDIEAIEPDTLVGFFEGWPDPPTPEIHWHMLANADRIVLAFDAETERVVGFINALTDHVLAAYIPLLEVLPDYRRQGIGAELVRRMLDGLRDVYMVDLMCDAELQPFYRRLGMVDAQGASLRNYARQSGKA